MANQFKPPLYQYYRQPSWILTTHMSLTNKEEIHQKDCDFWTQEHTNVIQEQDESIQEVANHNGMNDRNVAPIVTIHKAGVNFNLCHILVNADPAAIKLTAFAVVDVITITNKAIIPKPSFEAIVDGSESFGSNALFIKAVAIVAVKPMKANQNSPMLAPKNDQPVALTYASWNVRSQMMPLPRPG